MKKRQIIGLTVNNSNVVPLTIGNPNVVPMTVKNPNVIPMTIGTEIIGLKPGDSFSWE